MAIVNWIAKLEGEYAISLELNRRKIFHQRLHAPVVFPPQLPCDAQFTTPVIDRFHSSILQHVRTLLSDILNGLTLANAIHK